MTEPQWCNMDTLELPEPDQSQVDDALSIPGCHYMGEGWFKWGPYIGHWNEDGFLAWEEVTYH